MQTKSRLGPPFGATRAANRENRVMSDAALAKDHIAGEVTGGVKTLLRLEGLALFAAMVALYALQGGSWWIFAVLFLLPDLSFAAYLAGPRAGAVAYNAAHSYLLPAALLALGLGLS